MRQIVPTNRPGFITPLGSSARLTRSARAQSGRGSPQTRSRSFQAVGQRGRIRLPPSRTGLGAEAVDLGGERFEARSTRGRGRGRSRCRRGPGRPSGGVEVRGRTRTTDEGRRLATKLTGPTSAAGNSVRADQSGSASAPSRTTMLVRAQLDHQAIDLPGDRRGVVLEADDQDPVARRQAQRLAQRAGPPERFRSSSAIGRVAEVLSRSSAGARPSAPANGTQASAEASGRAGPSGSSG